jgi:HemK-related putative methylase
MSEHAHGLRTSLPRLRLALPRAWLGRVLEWRYRLFGRKRHRQVVLERVGSASVLVTPDVLNPCLTRSGSFFASQLAPRVIPPDADVLDMGTGSGVCALVAAKYARSVVAVDISAAAVRCARANALINDLEHRIEVLQGDLFGPLDGRTFDVILFNPPFVRGVPRNDADRAWRSVDVPERFAAGLSAHLKPRGFALVLLSTFGDAAEFVGCFRRHGLELALVAEKHYVNERLTLLKLWPGLGAPGAGLQ